MIVLTKKAKIISAAVIFAAIAAAGCLIEHFSKDAFIEEVVATEDAVLFEEPTEEGGSLININTADIEELSKLYGIGEALASRIVDYRESNGRYETIQEIMKVPGINDKKFEDIKNYICTD